MASRTIIAGVAAVGVLVGVTALPATGHDVKPTGTLTFTGKARKGEQKNLDVRPKGPSVGDRFLGGETLRRAGAVAGRVEIDCVGVDRRFEGQACQLTLLLKEGQVTAQGAGLNRRLAGVAPTTTAAGDEFAITGGTRAYRGASGTLMVKSASSGDTVTVAFAP